MNTPLNLLKKIHATCRECIEINEEPDDKLEIWNSKFGGLPYLPLDMLYPTTNEGKPLHLLAQINFSELPTIESFPKEGLLQFYIADDDLYGLNWNDGTKQEKFRIIYHPQILKHSSEIKILESNYTPVERQCRLVFSKKIHTINYMDYRYEQFLNSIDNDEILKQDFDKIYTGLFESNLFRSQIGGYPSFTQQDPRELEKKDRDKDLLLLQITSSRNVMWGDYGIANFFISKEKIEKLDFSDVLYNWDCH